jgi:hypothetical protein
VEVDAVRGEFALLHLVLRLTYLGAFLFIAYRTRKGTWPGPTGLMPFVRVAPACVLASVVCFLLGNLIKSAEDLFVPYVQGPNRPLSQEEWWWRSTATFAYLLGLPGLFVAVNAARRGPLPETSE